MKIKRVRSFFTGLLLFGAIVFGIVPSFVEGSNVFFNEVTVANAVIQKRREINMLKRLKQTSDEKRIEYILYAEKYRKNVYELFNMKDGAKILKKIIEKVGATGLPNAFELLSNRMVEFDKVKPSPNVKNCKEFVDFMFRGYKGSLSVDSSEKIRLEAIDAIIKKLMADLILEGSKCPVEFKHIDGVLCNTVYDRVFDVLFSCEEGLGLEILEYLVGLKSSELESKLRALYCISNEELTFLANMENIEEAVEYISKIEKNYCLGEKTCLLSVGKGTSQEYSTSQTVFSKGK